MPTLLVDCPYTQRKFSTGVETTAKSMRVLWKARLEVNCPHCHKTHKISVREAYLDGVLSDDTMRLRQNILSVGGMERSYSLISQSRARRFH